jgi:hypothetical protein
MIILSRRSEELVVVVVLRRMRTTSTARTTPSSSILKRVPRVARTMRENVRSREDVEHGFEHDMELSFHPRMEPRPKFPM